MDIKQELIINKFGQNLLDENDIVNHFDLLGEEDQKSYLLSVVNLIIQSKTQDDDIGKAIANSNLRPSYTPCVLLLKGTNYNNLNRIVNLPKNERKKALILFLHLFKIGYLRRFEKEKNDLNKWWYWDLSDGDNIRKILNYGK